MRTEHPADLLMLALAIFCTLMVITNEAAQ